MRLCNGRKRRVGPLCLGVALAVVMAGAGAESQTTASAMSKYVDTGFGFSFWYPTAWTVTQEPVDNPTRGGWYRGGTIVRRLRIAEPVSDADNGGSGVVLEELSAPRGFLTVLGQSKSASPVGVDQKFFFDKRTRTWMAKMLSEAPDGSPPSTGPAGVCGRAMGGLAILCGAERHGAGVIVPLDPTHFLALTTMDAGGDQYEQYVAETILAKGADAVRRESAQVRADTIRREALKLGAIGESVGDFYKDSEHVYNSEGVILPGIDPKSFARMSESWPNSFFVTDGIHVYDSGGDVIPSADPKTFVATNPSTAKDAHHTYDWNAGYLKIDGVIVRK